MLYLKNFTFPSGDNEAGVITEYLTKWHNSIYPFKILSANLLEKIDFAPITILYGSNGSGKTTALNVIAEKLRIQRGTLFNSSTFFERYLELCSSSVSSFKLPENSRIITSDDVFDFCLNKRIVNGGIDDRREELIKEYLSVKAKDSGAFRYHEDKDLEELNKIVAVRNNTLSMYVKKNIGLNIKEKSNGETAIRYFMDNITENALYLLDEPENSLASQRQIELAQYLEEAVRFYNCQLIIASHSPFLLSMKEALVYDFDSRPVTVRKWQELEGIRLYYDFFKQHDDKFSL